MPYARQCDYCRQVVTPRGDLAPRFCPNCGARLGGAPVEAPGGVTPGAPFVYRKTSGAAIASLVLGLLGLVPFVGFPLGIVAVVLGASSGGRIKNSRGTLGGEGMATAGLILGILGTLFHIVLCLNLH
jgi:hypothetical protein